MNDQKDKSHALVRILPGPLRRRVEHRPGLIKILDNIGWLFFDKILRMGVGLLVGLWVARYLGPGQFGQLNYAIAFVSLFGAIAGLGLNGIVVRDLVRDPQSANVTLGTAFTLQALAGLFAMVLAILGISLLRPDDGFARILVMIISTSLIFKSSEIIKYWFESRVESRYVVWIENGVYACMAVLRIGLILSESPLIAFAWLVTIETAVIAIGLFVIFLVKNGNINQWQIHIERAKSLLIDSWPLIISSVAIIIYMRIDQIMLGEMIGEEAVGHYSAAAKISEAWYFIPIMIVNSVFPAILNSKKNNSLQYMNRMQNLYTLLTIISISVAVILSFISEWLMIILYGDDFSGSGAILSIQIWAGIFVSMGIARGKWLLAENFHHIGYWYISAAMIINIIGNYLLIPVYGAIGAASATVIAQATAAIVAPALFRKTRISSIMLLKSLNPIEWIKIFRNFQNFNLKNKS